MLRTNLPISDVLEEGIFPLSVMELCCSFAFYVFLLSFIILVIFPPFFCDWFYLVMQNKTTDGQQKLK